MDAWIEQIYYKYLILLSICTNVGLLFVTQIAKQINPESYLLTKIYRLLFFFPELKKEFKKYQTKQILQIKFFHRASCRFRSLKIMKSTPESNDANSTSSNVGRFIVDIRVFMLSITIAMCASFFAGVTMVPAAWEGQVQDGTLHSPSKAAAAETAATAAPCQHVLMDISGVSSSFSNSESLLTDAMALTIQQTGLTMLSYHCHELEPEGISCVAVLMDGSHFTFHTWPTEGVITLDLFTCDSHLALLPSAITAIKTGFGIPRRSRENDTAATDAASDSDSEEVEPVHVKWSHEWRGYRMEDESDENKIPKSGIAVIDEYSDLSLMVLSPLNMYSKEQVYSNLTKYHRVDIFDEVEVGPPFLF